MLQNSVYYFLFAIARGCAVVVAGGAAVRSSHEEYSTCVVGPDRFMLCHTINIHGGAAQQYGLIGFPSCPNCPALLLLLLSFVMHKNVMRVIMTIESRIDG